MSSKILPSSVLDSERPARPTGWTVAHDFLFANGGAEIVTRWLCHDVVPDSRLVYLSGDQRLVAKVSDGPADQVLPRFISASSYRYLAGLIPLLVRATPRIDSNLLVSSYAFASGLRTTGAKVIYCHSPLRQAWSDVARYSSHGPLLERLGTKALGSYFRHLDRSAARSSDRIIATSHAVQQRIQRFYGLDAPVIAPPIDEHTFRYEDVEPDDYYIWAGRITEPYKQLGIVMSAFEKMPDRRLLVVGEGRDRARLEAASPPNVSFVGWRSREDLSALYRRALALIMPSEDDFGLVAVEAMACGAPVIAYAAGGALDTVEPGRSGVMFNHQTAADVQWGVRQFEQLTWDRKQLARTAIATWGRARFRAQMHAALEEVA